MTNPHKWATRINRLFSPYIIDSYRDNNKIGIIVDVDAMKYTDFGMQFPHCYSNRPINPVAYGVARCHKNDTFDYNIGRAVAICNALAINIPNFD